MRMILVAAIAMAVTSHGYGNSAVEHAEAPELLNNTWHVYACKDLPHSTSDSPVNCNDDDQLIRHSFIHVEQTHGSAVIVSMKLPQHNDLQVFTGTIEKTEYVDEMETGRMIRFFDNAQGQGTEEYKRLHLKLVRTADSESIGGKECEDLLKDFARGNNVFSAGDKAICQSTDDQGRKLNVVYWRVAPDKDLGSDSGSIKIPPGDGQGSGSDEPPN